MREGDDTIAGWNRKRTEPESAGGAVLARLEWFDRPEFAPAADRAERLEPRHARIQAGISGRRGRLGLARLVRRATKTVVVVTVSGALVAGVSMYRPRADAAPSPHDPVTRGLHRPAHAPAERNRAARTPAPAHRVAARPTTKPRPPAAHTAPKPAAKPATAAPRPTPKPAPKPRPAAVAPVAPVSLPAFTWTPLVTATGYEFQLFRGSELVYRARTPKPSITLPPAWTFHGRLVRVTPGTYRWYVWPLAGDKRGDTAVVQAKLTVG